MFREAKVLAVRRVVAINGCESLTILVDFFLSLNLYECGVYWASKCIGNIWSCTHYHCSYAPSRQLSPRAAASQSLFQYRRSFQMRPHYKIEILKTWYLSYQMKLNSQHKRSICTNSCEASSHGTCFSSVTLGYLKRKCVSVSRRRIPKILKSNILNKVCGCYLVTFLNQTAIFDWCVVRWGSRNNHHKDTCFKRVRTMSSNWPNTPHSIVHTIGRPNIFNQEINQHALSKAITISERSGFQSDCFADASWSQIC